jgi:tetratricopeptide (TPR) repeat protein
MRRSPAGRARPLGGVRGLLLAVVLPAMAVVLAPAPPAQAQPPGVAGEASRRFQRGVQLYNEGDFRAALVEFRRAYALLPRASALYNIGQTEFQLREYAAALQTLERFLAETGKQAPHHAEVQQTVEVLRDRVGRIDLTSDRDGCDVLLDEQAAGTTPLPESLLVSIGRRRVIVVCPGGPRAAREVEVAARETVRVSLRLGPPAPDPASVAARSSGPAPVSLSAATPGGRAARHRGPGALGWTANAVLAAATASAYTAAALGSRQLERLRRSYPVTLSQLQTKALLNRRLALAGDVLALATLASLGLSAYLSFDGGEEEQAARQVQIGLTAGGLSLGATF